MKSMVFPPGLGLAGFSMGFPPRKGLCRVLGPGREALVLSSNLCEPVPKQGTAQDKNEMNTEAKRRQVLCSTAGRKNFLVSEQCGMGGLGVSTQHHPTPQMCRWQLDLLLYMRSTAKRYHPVAVLWPRVLLWALMLS